MKKKLLCTFGLFTFFCFGLLFLNQKTAMAYFSGPVIVHPDGSRTFHQLSDNGDDHGFCMYDSNGKLIDINRWYSCPKTMALGLAQKPKNWSAGLWNSSDSLPFNVDSRGNPIRNNSGFGSIGLRVNISF